MFSKSLVISEQKIVQKIDFHEIITKKEDFYKIKTELEKTNSFIYSAIEWRAVNNINLNRDQSKKMIEVLNTLDELDDVQSVYTNAKLNN